MDDVRRECLVQRSNLLLARASTSIIETVDSLLAITKRLLSYISGTVHKGLEQVFDGLKREIDADGNELPEDPDQDPKHGGKFLGLLKEFITQ